MSFDQYSQTPASNDLTGYFKTGMRPSSVKNAGWDIMADMKQQLGAIPTAGGSANAQTVTNTRAIGALFAGLQQWFLPVAANTAGTTLAIDGLTAKNIFNNGAALKGGELKIGVPALVKYDGTQFHLEKSVLFRNYNQSKSTTTAGTNTITQDNLNPMQPPAYLDCDTYTMKILNTTTAAATMNINSLGALNMYYSDGTTQLVAGSLIANNTYTFIYDSSLNAAAGGFICINPSRATSSFTITLTGYASNPTGTVNYAIGADGKTFSIWLSGGAITGTSNSTSMTGTGIPSSLTTTVSKQYFCVVRDSGSNLAGSITTGTSTTWGFAVGAATAFTGSGLKGLPASFAFVGTLD